MSWSPRARATFAFACSIVILLFFLGLSIATVNWRFFLWSVGPAIISVSTGLAQLTPRRPTPHQGSR